MADKATLAKARQELEDLYIGVPDDSVNLSFKDLANTQQAMAAEIRKKTMEPIQENDSVVVDMAAAGKLAKSPSLDFTKGLEASRVHHRVDGPGKDYVSPKGSSRRSGRFMDVYENSLNLDDISVMSVTSRSSRYEGRGGRKRLGIPHTNICTICSVYIYIFKHRCLVCGRVFCRQCVGIGMGEMTEGRKCIECLGRRFSQRYIHQAGDVGCCMGYSGKAKQQELKWAELGPRRSGERRYGSNGLISRSKSPVMPRSRTPTRMHVNGSPTSFTVSGSYSPTHHLPF